MRREKVKREFALQLYADSVRAGAVRPVCPKVHGRGAQEVRPCPLTAHEKPTAL